MELKAWEYDEFPAFDENVEGAQWLDTSADDMGVAYVPDVEYECIDGLLRVLQILIPSSRRHKAPRPGRVANLSVYRVCARLCVVPAKRACQHLLRGADHGGAEFWTPDVLDIVDRFIKEHLS